MRSLFIGGVVLYFTGSVFAQGITEFGAVAAGATVGGAAGKVATDALSRTLTNVAAQTSDAANAGVVSEPKPQKLETERVSAKFKSPKQGSKEDAAQKGSGILDSPFFASLLELPELPDGLTPKGLLSDVLPSQAPAPPPEMSVASFKNVSTGMNRADLLRFGAPSFRMTMDEDGHLVEIYSYTQAGSHIGTVRLSDGAVAKIQ